MMLGSPWPGAWALVSAATIVSVLCKAYSCPVCLRPALAVNCNGYQDGLRCEGQEEACLVVQAEEGDREPCGLCSLCLGPTSAMNLCTP